MTMRAINDEDRKRNAEYMVMWRKKNPEKSRTISRRCYRKNPKREEERLRREKNKGFWKSCSAEHKRGVYLQWKYGLSTKEYQGLVEAAGTDCPICGKSFGEVVPVVDHDHKNNLVRGIICRQCNSAIGMLKDDADILMRAIMWVGLSKQATE
jgi:hypothetical protein